MAPVVVSLLSSLGCSDLAEDGVDVPDDSLGANAVASSGALQLKATVSTQLKVRPESTAKLTQDQKCTIPANTIISLKKISSSGSHVSGVLAGNVTACQGRKPFQAGAKVFLFDEHFEDSLRPVPGSGKTCDPRRATGAVSRTDRAMLDVIAYALKTQNQGGCDGYCLRFGVDGENKKNQVNTCHEHPNITGREWVKVINKRGKNQDVESSRPSAGRYDLFFDTWDRLKRLSATYKRYRSNLNSFEPEHQDVATLVLITEIRAVSMLKNAPMNKTQFENALSRISYEWEAIPAKETTGRYITIPPYSVGTLWTRYCAQVGNCS